MLPTRNQNLGPPNMPRKFWAWFGAIRQSWSLKAKRRCNKLLLKMAQAGLLDSAHDCSEGGLAVALAECGFAHTVGSNIQLELLGLPAEFVLFGEDASRVVISCNRDNLPRVQQLPIKYRLTADIIGETVPGHTAVTLDG